MGGGNISCSPSAGMSFWRRLRGLAFAPPGSDLHLPRCRSVHTFGMRYPLDLLWLDAAGEVLRIDRAVPPRRVRTCWRARSVIERPSAAAAGTARTAGGG